MKLMSLLFLALFLIGCTSEDASVLTVQTEYLVVTGFYLDGAFLYGEYPWQRAEECPAEFWPLSVGDTVLVNNYFERQKTVRGSELRLVDRKVVEVLRYKEQNESEGVPV